MEEYQLLAKTALGLGGGLITGIAIEYLRKKGIEFKLGGEPSEPIKLGDAVMIGFFLDVYNKYTDPSTTISELIQDDPGIILGLYAGFRLGNKLGQKYNW